ncbi:MAG TPA: L,D-transpeptidase family protein [Gemmatimonadales bacterium]|nr:L,D-transpeptidase family protein [Gemmatimonadales bacterium]
MALRWVVALMVVVTRVAAQQAPAEATRVRAALSRAGPTVRAFYAARDHAPAWTGGGPAAPAARELAAALQVLERDGLEPRRYGTARIDRLLSIGADSSGVLDVALTTAFVTAGRHLALGRVQPETVDSMWRGAARGVDVTAALRRAAEQQRPAAELAALAPPHPGYHALRAALARYRGAVAVGGWPRVGSGPVLAVGDSGTRVRALRDRLVAEGDFGATRGAGFDSATVEAVRRFQRRHGLSDDGRVGPATVTALDVSAARRARQIVLNLERWRWVPREAGVAPIIVNSAAFTATRHAPGSEYQCPAIVGRPDWPTPIVAGAVTGIVFAPAWRVPRAILVREVLPAAAGDPGYFARLGFHMVDSTGASIAGDSVGWEALADSTRRLTLVQDPGPLNPLGGVKIVFDNPFTVYVHGTPEQALFDAPVRTMSHGCVRVQGVLELARVLLADRPEWTADSIVRAAADTVERYVRVADGTVMVLGYWTAWVADDGAVQFRRDVYGWDAKLDRALGR